MKGLLITWRDASYCLLAALEKLLFSDAIFPRLQSSALTQRPLRHEVDIIFSVSDASFTVAYYGL